MRDNTETPLSRFLLKTRSGHCEYFATATVLLLRKLNVPARYAIGYAVHEPSGRKYVVRQRDAHSWCLVWDDKSQLWRDFDTTPASWVEAETKNAGAFQWLSDVWSGIRFQLAKIRWGQTRLREYLMWALAPILALLLFQILFRSNRQRQRRKPAANEKSVLPGLDSEFYELEESLAQRLPVRQAGEPLSGWLQHARKDPQLAGLTEDLERLLRFHYAYRFDPLGLNPTTRELLRNETRICLARLRVEG